VRSRLKALCTKDCKPDTVAELIKRLFTNAEIISQASIEAAECGLTYKRKQDAEGEHQRAKDAAQKTRQNMSRQRDIQDLEVLDPCPGCGMTNHKLADCRLDGHPHYNKTTNVPWLNSTWGVRYAAAGKTCLKYGMDEKGNKMEMRQSAAPLKKRSDREEKKKFQKKLEYHAHDAIILASICSSTDPNYLVAGRLTGASVKTKSNFPVPHMQVKTLLDTGAVMGNYCSKAVGD
jgi:hypothetical protein